jgi:hypothetical protein
MRRVGKGYHVIAFPLVYMFRYNIYVELVCPITFTVMKAYNISPIPNKCIITEFRQDYPWCHIDVVKRSKIALMLNRLEINAAFGSTKLATHPANIMFTSLGGDACFSLPMCIMFLSGVMPGALGGGDGLARPGAC